MSRDWEPRVHDCWCEQEHTSPFTELGHLVLTELRIPVLVEWLSTKLRRNV